jgi:hypothetical protein
VWWLVIALALREPLIDLHDEPGQASLVRVLELTHGSVDLVGEVVVFEIVS